MAEKSPLTIEERLTQLNEAKTRLETQHRKKETHQTPPPKIQRVAHHLRDRQHFAKHYFPKLVSIGPIHHGGKGLQLGEQYKLMWTVMYIESTEQTAQTLHKKIADDIEELKDLFSKDALGGFDGDEELSWMLFVDGCSLLQIMEKTDLYHPEELNVKLDQLFVVVEDVLLLENQLPFRVLKLLSSQENKADITETMLKFLQCHNLSPERPTTGGDAKRKAAKGKLKDQDQTKDDDDKPRHHIVGVQQEAPIHLLDCLHRTVLGLHDRLPKEANEDKRQKAINENNNTNNNNDDDDNYDDDDDDDMITHRNIQELKAAGIVVKRSNSRCLENISFSPRTFSAQLKLPAIIVDDTTAPTLLNLIAYEMCPDFDNDYDICSFVIFFDSLIDHPDDVKELRSAGILDNALGSDEEVAKLFNTIADSVPDTGKYDNIRAAIQEHYRKEWKTWITQGYHTYFSTPWTITAFLAAFSALALTLIQTVLAFKC